MKTLSIGLVGVIAIYARPSLAYEIETHQFLSRNALAESALVRVAEERMSRGLTRDVDDDRQQFTGTTTSRWATAF